MAQDTQQDDREIRRATFNRASQKPEGYRPLTPAAVREIQTKLAANGFATGPADGIKGPMTTAAITQWQKRHGAAAGLTDANGDYGMATLDAVRAFDRKMSRSRDIPALQAQPGQRDPVTPQFQKRVQDSIRAGVLDADIEAQDLYKKLASAGMNAPQSDWAKRYSNVRTTVDVSATLSDEQFLVALKQSGDRLGLTQFTDQIELRRQQDGSLRPSFKTQDATLQQSILDLRFQPEVSARVLAAAIPDMQRRMVPAPGMAPSDRDVMLGFALGPDRARLFSQMAAENPHASFREAFPDVGISGTVLIAKSRFAQQGGQAPDPTVKEIYDQITNGFDTGKNTLRLSAPPQGTPTAATLELQRSLKTLGFDIGTEQPTGIASLRTDIARRQAEGMVAQIYPDVAKRGGAVPVIHKLARAAEADAKAFGISNTGATAAIRMAHMTHKDIDMSYYMALASRESGFKNNIYNADSNATGLFQFIDQTWLAQVKRHGDQHGLGEFAAHIDMKKHPNGAETFSVKDKAIEAQILNLRNSPHYSALMAAEFTKENKAQLTAVLGRQPGQGELYLSHFLGGRDAVAFLQAYKGNPDQPAADLFREPAKYNPSVFYKDPATREAPKTLREILADMNGSFNTRQFHNKNTTARAALTGREIAAADGEIMTVGSTPAPTKPGNRPGFKT